MVACCIFSWLVRRENVEKTKFKVKYASKASKYSFVALETRKAGFSGCVMLRSGSFIALLGFSPRRLSKDDYCFLGHSPRETVTANQAAPALKEPSGI